MPTLKTLLPYIGISVLTICAFMAGSHWGIYQFGKFFTKLNTQTFIEKSMPHHMLYLNTMRFIDKGNISSARESLKGGEDILISTLDIYKEHLDEESYLVVCGILQNIAAYRKENKDKYGGKFSPIDPNINEILTAWASRDCHEI